MCAFVQVYECEYVHIFVSLLSVYVNVYECFVYLYVYKDTCVLNCFQDKGWIESEMRE